MTQTSELTELSELDALYREGILTEDEHSEAHRRITARLNTLDLPRVPRHAAPEIQFPPLHRPRTTSGGGRHAKAASPRWPWLVLAGLLAIAISAVGVALSRHPTHPVSALNNTARSSATTEAPPIIGGSRLNAPVTVNMGGATANIIVSTLTPLKAPAVHKSTDVTLQAAVTAVGVTGSFTLTPTEFTVQTSDGHMYKTASGSFSPVQVTTGNEDSGEVLFTLPKAETVTAVLFTSPRGEQLSVWSTS